jgi:hypothetical protein
MLLAPMLAPLSAAATDPGTIDNVQILQGDVFATPLTVVDSSGSVTVSGSATGNSLLVGTDVGTQTVTSTQIIQPAPPPPPFAPPPTVDATASLTIGGYTPGPITMSSVATGNAVQATSTDGASEVGSFYQTGNGAAVTATNNFSAQGDPTITVGDVSLTAQAIGNTVGLGATGSSLTATVNQLNTADVHAVDQSSPGEGAQIQDTTGSATATAIAVNNNVTATGVTSATYGGSTQALNITQTAIGQTMAGQVINSDNGQTFVGTAAASANNVSASNQGGDLNVVTTQTNEGFTQGDSVVTAVAFGSVQVTGSGVGNSMVAGNQGPSTELSNVQVNDGEIQGRASFTGGGGVYSYDVAASSSAVGNGATAFTCSDCGGVLSASNSQTNNNTIEATSLVTLNGANRTVVNSATAVGNSASFYVTKPK